MVIEAFKNNVIPFKDESYYQYTEKKNLIRENIQNYLQN